MAAAFARAGYDSTKYRLMRPRYPPVIFQRAKAFLTERLGGQLGMALDVGCGPGIATAPLSSIFDRVIGLDPSGPQLSAAEKPSNVEYFAAEAENFEALVSRDSVDLVFVGQAIHWFNLEAFFRQCKRALRKDRGSCLLVAGYDSGYFAEPTARETREYLDKEPVASKAMSFLPKNEALSNAYTEWNATLDWDPRKALVDCLYSNIDFPFKVVEREYVSTAKEMTLEQLLAYISTWSAVQEGDGCSAAVHQFQKQAMSILNTESLDTTVIYCKTISIAFCTDHDVNNEAA